MEYTWRQKELYNKAFYPFSSISSSSVYTGNVTLDQNNAFQIFCNIEIHDESTEVPCFLAKEVEKSKREGYNKVVLPLYNTHFPVTKKTSDSIINYLFTADASERLKGVITSKGDKYYGTRGFILDRDFNIIFLSTIQYNEGIYENPTLYINPSVFIESDKILNKVIVKKLIPYYLTNAIRGTWVGESNRKIQIVIADVTNKILQTPVTPTIDTFSNEKINDFLVDNLDEVLSLIR